VPYRQGRAALAVDRLEKCQPIGVFAELNSSANLGAKDLKASLPRFVRHQVRPSHQMNKRFQQGDPCAVHHLLEGASSRSLATQLQTCGSRRLPSWRSRCQSHGSQLFLLPLGLLHRSYSSG